MDTSKPGPLLMMGGGALMVIASFLDWRLGNSGLSTDSFGLLGIFTLLFGIAIVGVAATRTFAPGVNLPSHILGFSLDKLCVMLAFTVFLWTFGVISGEVIDAGIHLTWIGAAVATVGGILSMRSNAAPTAAI